MYKNGELGSVEQRLPNNLIRLKAGQDGDDEELINSLLSMDTDNLYHVEFIDTLVIDISNYNTWLYC
jgi:hypothetical protein